MIYSDNYYSIILIGNTTMYATDYIKLSTHVHVSLELLVVWSSGRHVHAVHPSLAASLSVVHMQAAIVVTPSVLSVCSGALAMLLTAVSAGEREESGQVDLSQLVLVDDIPVKPPTQSPMLTTEVRAVWREGDVWGRVRRVRDGGSD